MVFSRVDRRGHFRRGKTLEKGKEELNKKIAEKTKKDNAAKKTAADENQTGGEEKTDGE